jgi:putative transposase
MHCFYRTWFTHSKPGVGNRPAGAENLIRADHGRLTATAESCRRRGLQHGSDRRAFLAALLHRLPRQVLHRLRLLVPPETVLRWQRDLIRRRHAAISRPKRAGRPPTVRSIRALVLRLAHENSSWGYRRIHGELLVLEIKVAASTVWEVLQTAGIDPASQRTSTTWAAFLRSQAEAIIAADFLETVTSTGAWVTQVARNLAMDPHDAGCQIRYVIRDRDRKYPAPFDAVLADTGITTVLTGIQVPA